MAGQRPGLDPDPVLYLNPIVLIPPKGDVWGSGQVKISHFILDSFGIHRGLFS